MNGAESLVQTLLNGGIDVCFSNPGTSEMHFVAALDSAPQMRCVLCLFEGVATGAADGYARMAGKPAATLLHLGPGLANGLANVHNAKKAGTPMVNVVGEHASYHIALDAPLTADIETTAQPYSHWIRTAISADTVAADGAAAIEAAWRPPGQIATLILPGDTAWNTAIAGVPATVAERQPPQLPAQENIDAARKALLSGERCLLLMSGSALSQSAQRNAARIAAKTNVDLLTATSNPRLERGAGCVSIARVPYPVDQAVERLKDYRYIILAAAKPPVGFFAYPDKPGRLWPEHCEFINLANIDEDAAGAIEWLCEAVDAAGEQPILVQTNTPPQPPAGALTGDSLATAVAALMPEGAIISDESVSLGRGFFSIINNTVPHSWLQIMGGAIGLGMPMATGAAVACPERRVISLQADGSAMYTVQALWTQAREQLDVTTVILANREYAILKHEMKNVGVGELGPKAQAMLELNHPELNWVALAQGMGVPAKRVTTADEFVQAFAESIASEGPYLIEAMV